jgi:hypothetical protein
LRTFISLKWTTTSPIGTSNAPVRNDLIRELQIALFDHVDDEGVVCPIETYAALGRRGVGHASRAGTWRQHFSGSLSGLVRAFPECKSLIPGERIVVDRIFTSSNRLVSWLRQIDAFRRVA